MAGIRETQIKELTATGAVSTDNKAGVLHHVIFTGATVGDKLAVADGATNKLTLVTAVANDPIQYSPPTDKRPVFETDIAATITKTGDAFATFIYEEIE